MRIRQLLEAEIKVPQTAVNEAMAVVLSALFSRAMAILIAKDMEDYQIKLEQLASRYMKKFGRFEIYDSYGAGESLSHNIQFPLKELPDNYFKMNKSRRVRSLDLDVFIGDGKSAHADVDLDDLNIAVYLPNEDTLQQMSTMVEYIPAVVAQLESVVRHELMHVVQKLMWNKFQKGSIDYYDSENKLIYDKYYSHDEEFGPLIQSALGNIKSKESAITTQRGSKLSVEEKKGLIRELVVPKPSQNAPKRGVEGFFAHLYTHDHQKWKKAVKELYGLYMRS